MARTGTVGSPFQDPPSSQAPLSKGGKMFLKLPPRTSSHLHVWAFFSPPNRTSTSCSLTQQPAPKPARDLAEQIELGWFVFIVLDGQRQHLLCPATGRVYSPLEVRDRVMLARLVTPPAGIPGSGPGPRAAGRHRQTQTLRGTRRLPAGVAQRVLGRKRKEAGKRAGLRGVGVAFSGAGRC